MMRSLLISLSLLLLINTGCHQKKHQPGICLSFDDRPIKEWHQMRALLKRYHAHVTFFVTQFDSLSATEIQMLTDLQNDGHEIASHGALHVQAESYIKAHSYKEYLANEIEPSISSMKKAGFDPVSFAYPYGSKYWFTDYLLLKKFKSTRGVASMEKQNSLAAVDEIFYDFDNSRKLSSIEIDGPAQLTKAVIVEAMRRAIQNNEVLLLSGHTPVQNKAPGLYSFNSAFLESILKEANDRHLGFYRIRELSADQD